MVIEPTSSVKNNGATLDQCLSCESMAGSIFKKTFKTTISVQKVWLPYSTYQEASSYGPYPMSFWLHVLFGIMACPKFGKINSKQPRTRW